MLLRTCLTVSLATSASYLHRLTTLARHTPSCQWHRRETFVHRRRCHVALSSIPSPWRWCLSVVDVLWRWIAWLLRTTNRLCRQRHVTESHPTPRHCLQHTTTRSHCHLYQSINEHHKVDITFAARHQHVSVQKMGEIAYYSRMAFSIFMTQIFAHIPSLNHCLIHRTSIPP